VNYTKLAVIVSSAFLVFLIVFRSYYTLVTGYLLPDEAFYYNIFTVQGMGFSIYRPFLHLMFDAFFWEANTPLELTIMGVSFCAVWSVGCVFALYKITRNLGFNDKPSALVILSLPMFPIFTVMSVFYVTETVGLFLVLVGMYFSIAYIKSGGVKNAVLSCLFFVLAFLAREPYLLLVYGNFLILIFMRREWKALAGYFTLSMIVLPIPTSINPLSIIQPIASLAFVFLPAWILHLPLSGGPQPSAPPSSLPGYVFAHQNSLSISFGIPQMEGFGIGLLYGFGPVFLLFGILSAYYMIKERSKVTVFLLALIWFSFVAYYMTSSFAIDALPNAVTLWTSNFIRLSSGALPAIVGIGFLYSKVKARYVLAGFAVFMVLAAFMLPTFANAIQTSQDLSGIPVGRLSFGYRAPYYRMYGLLQNQSGSLVVVGSPGMDQLITYTSMLDNITVRGFPSNQSAFDKLTSRNWKSIYLYDSWVTILDPSFLTACECYASYYQSIVLSHSYGNWTIQRLWADGESFALQMVKR
jgi:hypothetical protein